MGELLFGLETEYSVAGEQLPEGETLDPEALGDDLLQAAEMQLPHLRAFNQGGIFLANGARFYVDLGGHPEYATPECSHPTELVRQSLAGDRILERLAQAVVAQSDGQLAVRLSRSNVDYWQPTTFGSHESYLYRQSRPVFAMHLIPHLVSRLIFTGSGGLHPKRGGVEFTLSPRVAFLEETVSASSTDHRGIYHTKDEPLCGNEYNRLHLICGDSLQSHVATWLRVGTTALVVAMIDAGLAPGTKVLLHDALGAMRRFAADPFCKSTVPLMNGTPTTAVAIQRHYLAMAEAHARAAFMPAWAPDVCREWRAMLDRIEQGAPESVSLRLDWAMKYMLYTRRLQHRQCPWEFLRPVNHAVDLAHQNLLESYDDSDGEIRHILRSAVQGRSAAYPREVELVNAILQNENVSPHAAALCLHVRGELTEADAQFGWLGERGIFASLDRAGVLQHHVDGVTDIEQAMETPPPTGRARIRGECVKRFAQSLGRYGCDWDSVEDHTAGQSLDLSDPFVSCEKWSPNPAPEPAPPSSPPARRRVVPGVFASQDAPEEVPLRFNRRFEEDARAHIREILASEPRPQIVAEGELSRSRRLIEELLRNLR